MIESVTISRNDLVEMIQLLQRFGASIHVKFDI